MNPGARSVPRAVGALLGLLGALCGCLDDVALVRRRDADEADAANGRDAANGDTAVADDGGSGALQIEGDLVATSRVSNAQRPEDFEVSVELRISRAGRRVSGARVTLASARGSLPLLESFDGDYDGQGRDYAGAYALTIEAGGTQLRDVPLVGPAIHTFSAPATDEHHHAGDALVVRWAPSGAGFATLEAGEIAESTIPDTGAVVVPGSAFREDPGSTREDVVRVRRGQNLAVPGAATGSFVRVSVRNAVRIRIDGM